MSPRALLLVSALALALGACKGGDAVTDGGSALTCSSLEAPTTCPEDGGVTFHGTVAPILESRCVPCHYGQPDGPWPLRTYDEVVDWSDVVRTDLLDCSMPPPDAGVPMTDEERIAILTFLHCGTPE